MVADPDPDGSDPFQIAVGFLEQVTHQLVQATLDCHLRAERSDSIGTGEAGSVTATNCGQLLFSGQEAGGPRRAEGVGHSVEVGESDRACVLAS